MLVVISPAKRLDMTAIAGPSPTEPMFQEDATHLAAIARELDPPALQKLMGISENLAKLNAQRFADFAPASTAENAKPAAFMFDGDTYAGLEATTLDEDALRWAQDHLRILSGLYGVLRPLDAIQPYRLEMGSKLANPRGRNLYDYWGARLSDALNRAAEKTAAEVLVNCASAEYFGAVDQNALNLRVVTPVFMEDRNGVPKIVSFYAKKARGAMARFICETRMTDPEQIATFDTGGYSYRPDLSEADRPVFVRADVS